MQVGRFIVDHASNLADIYAANAIARSVVSAILDGSELGPGSQKYVDLVERLSYTLYAGYAADSAYKFATDATRAQGGSETDDSRARSLHFAMDRSVNFAIGATTALASANAIAAATDSSVTSLLAVGGFSGAAIALASKDVSSNLVGGAMLLANHPLAAGDHITAKLGGVEISGTVAGVGLLQTRLVSKEGRVVYVPNALFLQIPIANNNRTVDHDESASYCTSGSSFGPLSESDASDEASKDQVCFGLFSMFISLFCL
jgi:small-conductance mechanosensitive channel